MDFAERLLSLRVRIIGRVQGVYFRKFTAESARRLGIRGWVRNEADGSVLALIQHEEQSCIDTMLAAMAEGPPAAQVDAVRSSYDETADPHEGFEILH